MHNNYFISKLLKLYSTNYLDKYVDSIYLYYKTKKHMYTGFRPNLSLNDPQNGELNIMPRKTI